MLLISHKNCTARIQLNEIKGVEEVYLCLKKYGSSPIDLACKEGDEQLVFDNLPKWVHDEMEVIKSYGYVMLRFKEKE